MADAGHSGKLRVAFVGSGISCLSAAWMLRNHDLTIFERDDHLGGHLHTRTISINDQVRHVDVSVQLVEPTLYPTLFALTNLPPWKGRCTWTGLPNTVAANYVTKDNGPRWWGNNVACQRRAATEPTWLSFQDEISRLGTLANQLDPHSAEALMPMGAWLQANGFSDEFAQLVVYPLFALQFDVSTFPALLLAGASSFMGFTPLQWYYPKEGYNAAVVQPLVEQLPKDCIKLGWTVLRCVRSEPPVLLEVQDPSGVKTLKEFDAVVYGGDILKGYAMGFPLPPIDPVCADSTGRGMEPIYGYLHQDESVLPPGTPTDCVLLVENNTTEHKRCQHLFIDVIKGQEFSPRLMNSLYNDPKFRPDPAKTLYKNETDTNSFVVAPTGIIYSQRLLNYQGKKPEGADEGGDSTPTNIYYVGANVTFNVMEPCIVSGLWAASKIDPNAPCPSEISSILATSKWM